MIFLRLFMFFAIGSLITTLQIWLGAAPEGVVLYLLLGGLGGVAAVDVFLYVHARRLHEEVSSAPKPADGHSAEIKNG